MRVSAKPQINPWRAPGKTPSKPPPQPKKALAAERARGPRVVGGKGPRGQALDRTA